jgi:predicted RNA-binding Zn-ribbon protein involved in translation (DUF1610 family)
MSNETIHRCLDCGIEPVYQTAKTSEPYNDLPNVVYRLECPNCGRHGAYGTSKQEAAVYWNHETFRPPKGRKK